MGNTKSYEEKQRHGTAEFPVGLHKLEYPEGTDVIFYLHLHQEFEFLVLTKGAISFTIEEREYELHEGDCVFINAEFLHSAKSIGQKACSFFAVDFSYAAIEDDIHSAFYKKYIRPVLQGRLILTEFLSSANEWPIADSTCQGHKEIPNAVDGIYEIDHFMDEFSGRPHFSWQKEVIYNLALISRCPEHELEAHQLFVRSRLYNIWNLIYHHGEIKKKKHPEENAVSERLVPVIQYMKENYAYEITLKELAALIPMSEGQFCRIFKSNMKMSPMQYLLRYRILQSCRFLKETEKKVGEIANMTGFNNISYFNKVFLKTIGCTPKEYRNNVNY